MEKVLLFLLSGQADSHFPWSNWGGKQQPWQDPVQNARVQKTSGHANWYETRTLSLWWQLRFQIEPEKCIWPWKTSSETASRIAFEPIYIYIYHFRRRLPCHLRSNLWQSNRGGTTAACWAICTLPAMTTLKTRLVNFRIVCSNGFPRWCVMFYIVLWCFM